MACVNINYARSVVEEMYPADKWRGRVRRMSDEQVLAIYYKHENGQHTKKTVCNANEQQAKETLFTPYVGEQLSFEL